MRETEETAREKRVLAKLIGDLSGSDVFHRPWNWWKKQLVAPEAVKEAELQGDPPLEVEEPVAEVESAGEGELGQQV